MDAGPGVPQVIAIDGPVASGKSSVGWRLAKALGYRFLDTGALYRAVTWLALRQGIDPGDEEALGEMARRARLRLRGTRSRRPRIWVDGEEATPYLRTPAVEGAVSLVSQVAAVRRALLAYQRRLARPPVVMAGRDIGTVVLPRAHLKAYLRASVEERGRRRHRELLEQGQEAPLDDVLRGLRRRDQIDSQRRLSPLRPAPDAVIIDTDGLSEDQVLERLQRLIWSLPPAPSTGSWPGASGS